MRTRRIALLVATIVAACAMAAPAGAATLWVRTDVINLEQLVYSPEYVGGAEPNRVVVAATGALLVGVYDPGVPITAGSDSVGGGCSSPTGKSAGYCLVEPVRQECQAFGGECGLVVGYFYHFVVNLGGGADKLTLAPGGLPAVVATGSGDDTVNARNKVVDRIECGNGADTVAADWKDVVYSTCESVTRG